MASSSTRAGVVGGAAVGAAGDVVAVLVAVAATGEMVIAAGAVGVVGMKVGVVGMNDARGWWSGCREAEYMESGKGSGWVCRFSIHKLREM